jgi:soluble lytic murein transglycosylase-like protein
MFRRQMLTVLVASAVFPVAASAQAPSAGLNEMIARHARENGVPEELVHRVIREESRYQERAVGRGGTMGLMQIKYSTARGLGYRGSAAGLLDPNTNLTWGVRYLAGAYRYAQGDQAAARVLYGTGY